MGDWARPNCCQARNNDTRIDEEVLANAVQCYPILYDKSMKEEEKRKQKRKRRETLLWELQQASPAPCSTLPYVVMSMFTLPTQGNYDKWKMVKLKLSNEMLKKKWTDQHDTSVRQRRELKSWPLEQCDGTLNFLSPTVVMLITSLYTFHSWA